MCPTSTEFTAAIVTAVKIPGWNVLREVGSGGWRRVRAGQDKDRNP